MTETLSKRERKNLELQRIKEELSRKQQIIETEKILEEIKKLPTLEIYKDAWKAKGYTKPSPYLVLTHPHFKTIILSTEEMHEILKDPQNLEKYTKIPKYLHEDVINLIEETIKEAET